MSKRFNIVSQSLVVTDSITGNILLDFPKSKIYYNAEKLERDSIVYIYNIDDDEERLDERTKIFSLSDCVDGDNADAVFNISTFKTFVRQNLGFKTASGGSGAVSSVFGRTGGVSAQAGDYDADKITETANRVFVTPAEKAAIGSGGVSSYSETFGDGVLSTIRITHNLNTTDFTHRVKEVATGRDAGVTVKDFDANNVDVESGVVIGLNELRITIIKS